MPRKIWTAAEVEELSPAERRRIFEESLVTDLSTVPPDFLERVREDTRRHIADRDAHNTG